MSGRNFRRLCVRYEEDGIDGLRDRRIGKVSPRRAPARELERMHDLYRECYSDFTVKHFHEQLVRRHNYKLCYTVTKLSLQAAGLVAKAKRRSAHRKKRVRRPLPGMLLFQDASKHRWIAAIGRDLDLVVTMDDATGAIYSALLVEEEGTIRASSAWRRRSRRKACLVRSTPIVVGITFSPARVRARLTRRNSPRSVGRFPNSALPTSRPIHRRGAGEWSGCSARCRSGCRRNCGSQKSGRLRGPIATVKSVSLPTTTRALRCPRPSQARPSCPMSGVRSRTFSAFRRIGWSAPTTACAITGAASRFRRSAIVSITCGLPCGYTNIRTAASPFLMARVVLSVSTRKDVAVISSLAPLKSAWRPTGLWICGQRKSVSHKPHRPTSNRRSGQMMCYKPRTSSRATDTWPHAGSRRVIGWSLAPHCSPD